MKCYNVRMSPSFLLFKCTDKHPFMTVACVLFVLSNSLQTVAFSQDRAEQAEQTRQQLYSAAQAIIAPEYVGRDIEKDLDCLASIKALTDFLADIEKEYASEIRQGNQPYRNVEGTIRYTRERINQFKNAITQYASLESINLDVEHTTRMLTMAIENQAPAYFNDGNDIANRRKSMKSKLSVLRELGATSELSKATSIVESLEVRVVDAQRTLGKQIIESNRLPSDGYRHSDRDEILKLVESTWLKAAPDKKPVKVGLIGDNWHRTEQWEVQNRTIYKVERSQLQGFVLIPNDAHTAACYRIQIRRDHIDNNRTSAWLLDDPAKAVEPRQLIVVSNLP